MAPAKAASCEAEMIFFFFAREMAGNRVRQRLNPAFVIVLLRQWQSEDLSVPFESSAGWVVETFEAFSFVSFGGVEGTYIHKKEKANGAHFTIEIPAGAWVLREGGGGDLKEDKLCLWTKTSVSRNFNHASSVVFWHVADSAPLKGCRINYGSLFWHVHIPKPVITFMFSVLPN